MKPWLIVAKFGPFETKFTFSWLLIISRPEKSGTSTFYDKNFLEFAKQNSWYMYILFWNIGMCPEGGIF